MENKKKLRFESIRELSLSAFYYTSGAIFGPLLIFGSLGYGADQFFGSRPKGMIAGVAVAFIATNFLLFKKISKINNLIADQGKKANSEPQEEDKK